MMTNVTLLVHIRDFECESLVSAKEVLLDRGMYAFLEAEEVEARFFGEDGEQVDVP